MSVVGNKVINIDGTGTIVGSELKVNGIIVIANANTWSCILKDLDGAVIFRADSSITNERTIPYSPAEPQSVKGIVADTLTNIAIVIVHLA